MFPGNLCGKPNNKQANKTTTGTDLSFNMLPHEKPVNYFVSKSCILRQSEEFLLNLLNLITA